VNRTRVFAGGLVLAVAALVGLVPVYGQEPYLTVSKAVTGISADGIPGYEILLPGDIAAFLANVPNSRVIVFEVTFTVAATGGPISAVVVTDNFGSDLTVACGAASLGSCAVTDGRRVAWDVGPLSASATLVVTATTNLDPGGSQRYTSCGTHYLNSGPTAKGTIQVPIGGGRTKDKQVSAGGPPIQLWVSGLLDVAFPACRNCIDDDGDSLIDYPADPGCTAPDDPDETDPLS